MNISATGTHKTDEMNAVSINVLKNRDKNHTESIASILGNASFAFSKENGVNPYQNYKSVLKEVTSVEEEMLRSAQTAKSSLKALFNKMSISDCVRMDEEGYNLNDLEPEEMVTVVDRIKIMLATYCEEYQDLGGNIDLEKIKQVTGSAGEANRVAAKMNEADIPQTKENIEEIENALSQAEKITPLTEKVKQYLVVNQLPPSIENIYKAEHSGSGANASGGYNKKQMSEEEWQQLKPQAEEIIKDAGLEVNQQTLNNAKAFIENNISVTKENLLYKEELDRLNLSDMGSEELKSELLDKIIENKITGGSAKDTLLTEDRPVHKVVAQAIQTAAEAEEKEVVYITREEREFTIENLRAEKSEYHSDKKDAYQEMDFKSLENYKKLQEIRILMTAEAGTALVRQGFNLDTTPIAGLVEELKNIEARLYGENAGVVFEVKKAVYDIKTAPDVVIGKILYEKEAGAAVTIGDFSESGNQLKQQFQKANQTYEAVGTEVRKDLGDSVRKAVAASTETILKELGLEITKANKDAVRILGYNGMEMTAENINLIKSTYSTLQSLIENMKPEAVLSMVKQGLNPMKTDIGTLNEYLAEENTLSDSMEKFSRFLHKLDKTNGITEEERKQFIGIYKMMNVFKKDAGKAIGALIKQEADITMSSLMTAYNSAKASGIDEILDENTGMSETAGRVNYFNNLFKETAPRITPKTLKTVNEQEAIAARSVENFCEAVQNNYDPAEEAKYYQEELKELKQLAEVEDSVLRQLSDNGQKITVNQIMAAQNIMASGYFDKLYKFDFVEKEKVRETLESFIENMDTEEGLYNTYDKLSSVMEQEQALSLEAENRKYEDINALRMMGKEIGLIQNLSLRHDFKIPFEAEGRIGMIHLKVVKDVQNSGTISIKFTTEKLGNVSIEAKVSEEKASIYGMTDKDSEFLQENLIRTAKKIPEILNTSDIEIHVGKTPIRQENHYKMKNESVGMDTLYGLAKTLVTGLIKEEK